MAQFHFRLMFLFLAMHNQAKLHISFYQLVQTKQILKVIGLHITLHQTVGTPTTILVDARLISSHQIN